MNQNPSPNVDRPRADTVLTAANLQRRVKSGANYFYWIAALSIISSPVSIIGVGITFILGLGLTQIVDGLASSFAIQLPTSAMLIRICGILISLCIIGIFVLFGLMAGRNHRWAFIAGMLLYGADTGLMLAFKDFLGFLFHLLFLFLLFGGLRALGQLRKTLPQTALDPKFP